MTHTQDRAPDGRESRDVVPATGPDSNGGDLQSDEAWADAGAQNAPPSQRGASEEGPAFEDPNDR